MKEKNSPFDLDQLLGSLEHAGRDSRRRESLASLIDQLSVQEARRVRRRRIGLVSAVAACLLLLVTVWLRFSGADVAPSAPLLAEANTDSSRGKGTSPVEQPEEHRFAKPPQSVVRTPLPMVAATLPPDDAETTPKDTMPLPETDGVTDGVADTLMADPFELEMQYAEQQAEQEPPVDVYEWQPTTVAPAEPVAVATPAQPKEKAKRHFRLRRANPSKMDGTMLCFRLK